MSKSRGKIGKLPAEFRATREKEGTRIFLSHAAIDRPLAEYVRDQLIAAGTNLTVFMASKPGHIPAYSEWLPVIQGELRGATAYFVLLTPNSVERPWVWFETGAAWMTGKPLVAALSAGLTTDRVPLPISARQLLSLERADEAAAIFNSLGLKLPDAPKFSQAVKELGKEIVAAGLREGGWEGIDFRGTFYAWDGPLARLEDYEPDSEPPGLMAELQRQGLSATWANRDRLAKHRAEGKRPIYATDRRKWRRAIVDRDTILVVSGPAEKPETRAERIQQSKREAEELNRFVRSRASVELAQKEIASLQEEMRAIVNRSNERAPDLHIDFRSTKPDCLIRLGRYSVRLAWDQPYSDGVVDAALRLSEFDGLAPLKQDDARPARVGRELSTESFELVLSPFRDWRWQSQTNSSRYFSASEIATEAFTRLLKRYEGPPPQEWTVLRR